MTRLSDIEARLRGMQELLQVVGAMRSLASMRVQEALRAIDSVRRYGSAMADATAQALALASDREGAADPPAAPARALVIFMSEQGFVGAYNDRVLEAAALRNGVADTLFILGSRGAALLQEQGHVPRWCHPMATHLAGIADMVRRLAAELYPLAARGTITHAEAVFARYRRNGAPAMERRVLFPLDLPPRAAKTCVAPLHNLPPAALLEELTGQYLLALLTEAATESLASENAARLAAMESARDNVVRKLAQLQQHASQARQEEITTELLELVAGEEAIRPS